MHPYLSAFDEGTDIIAQLSNPFVDILWSEYLFLLMV